MSYSRQRRCSIHSRLQPANDIARVLMVLGAGSLILLLGLRLELGEHLVSMSLSLRRGASVGQGPAACLSEYYSGYVKIKSGSRHDARSIAADLIESVRLVTLVDASRVELLDHLAGMLLRLVRGIGVREGAGSWCERGYVNMLQVCNARTTYSHGSRSHDPGRKTCLLMLLL